MATIGRVIVAFIVYALVWSCLFSFLPTLLALATQSMGLEGNLGWGIGFAITWCWPLGIPVVLIVADRIRKRRA